VLPRWSRYALAALAAAVLIAGFYLPRLRRRVRQFSNERRQEELARREVRQTPILTPTDVPVQAKLYFLATAQPGTLAVWNVELPLSADPIERSKQLIAALITDAPSAAARTVPAETTLLAFYLLPDGTAVADFSDALSAGTPSGILSEQLVVESLTETLGAGVPQIRRLKILLHGQETDTLAGHLDLTGFFAVNSETPTSASVANPPVSK
jgi:Sporulation and spore germination